MRTVPGKMPASTFSKCSCWITQVRKSVLNTGGSCDVRFSHSQLFCWRLFQTSCRIFRTSWRICSTKWRNNRRRPTGCLMSLQLCEIPPWMVCRKCPGKCKKKILLKVLLGMQLEKMLVTRNFRRGLWDLAAMGGECWSCWLLEGGRGEMGQWAAYKWYSLCEARHSVFLAFFEGYIKCLSY